MSNQRHITDFFIVGAPKCGTTAVDQFLSEHSGVFMIKKEVHYFGQDLEMIHHELTENEYADLFQNAEQGQLKGESSVWYLYSKTAAKELKQHNPKAKILIFLRNPISMLPSLHTQFLYNGDEDIADFESAFNDDEKKRVEGIYKKTRGFVKRPHFMDVIMYSEQINRYRAEFPNDQIHIVVHDDLINNFERTYAEILDFLNVNKIIPENTKVNVNKNIKSVKLHYAGKNPPKTLQRIFRFLVPVKSIRHGIMKNVEQLNVSEKKRAKLSNKLKNKLAQLTQSEVEKLSKLLKKDFSFWLNNTKEI